MTILATWSTSASVWCGAGLALCVALSLGCQTGGEAGQAVARSNGSADAEVVPVAPTAEAVSQRQDSQPQDPERQDPRRPDPEQGTTLPPFLENAFPPTVPDAEWHRDAWMQNDCLRCHETGVGNAPMLVHASLPDLAREVKCRTCHVFVPGSEPRVRDPGDRRFEADAFPPMIPGSSYHQDSWLRADCLLCHENGIKNAPVIRHAGLPPRLLESKCRTCHVQVRAIEHDESILRLLK